MGGSRAAPKTDPAARPAGTDGYAVGNQVSDPLDFAGSQGAGRFHLVGHDWGAILAWTLTGTHSERLKSLPVLSTPHPQALHAAATSDRGRDWQRRRFFTGTWT